MSSVHQQRRGAPTSAILSLLLIGCYAGVPQVVPTPSAPRHVEEGRRPGFFYWLVPTSGASSACPFGALATSRGVTGGDVALGLLTDGMFTPTHSAAVCADSSDASRLAAGQHIRVITPESGGNFLEATVDSATTDHAFVRWTGGNAAPGVPSRAVVPLATVQRLDLEQDANRSAAGESGLHYGAQTAIGVGVGISTVAGRPLFGLFLGAIYSVIADPAGFMIGAATAQPEWKSIEAHRIGSPLLVDDRVRVRLSDPARAEISGRLVDIERSNLLLSVANDTVRVPRANIRSLQRADGFNYQKGMWYGAGLGAAVGVASLTFCHCGSSIDRAVVPVAGALLGLYWTPGLSPRSWADVTRW